MNDINKLLAELKVSIDGIRNSIESLSDKMEETYCKLESISRKLDSLKDDQVSIRLLVQGGFYSVKNALNNKLPYINGMADNRN